MKETPLEVLRRITRENVAAGGAVYAIETTGPLAGHVADGLGHTNPAATCRCADRTMQERHPIDREAARKGFTE